MCQRKCFVFFFGKQGIGDVDHLASLLVLSYSYYVVVVVFVVTAVLDSVPRILPLHNLVM